MKIVFIINGQDWPVETRWPSVETLGELQARAMKDAGVLRDYNEFEPRAGTDGRLLDLQQPVGSLDLPSGSRVFATLRVGIGGNLTPERIREILRESAKGANELRRSLRGTFGNVPDLVLR